ncbi:MAG: hypothetical protein WDN04_06745 [Rhodospirillales bacterium]
MKNAARFRIVALPPAGHAEQKYRLGVARDGVQNGAGLLLGQRRSAVEQPLGMCKRLSDGGYAIGLH